MERPYLSRVILKREPARDSYLRDLPAVQYLMEHKSLSFTQNVTFFIGENGTGKSTLLEAIAIASGFNAEGGTKNFNFHTIQTHSALYEGLTLVRPRYAKDGFFLRAESFYNFATNLEELDAAPALSPKLTQYYGGRSLHRQSHGESFLALMQNRFGGNGLYLLDEPEAALSPARLMTLIVRLNDLVEQDSQFLIATHSPILMTFPGAQIFQFSERGVESVDYRETEHYQLTRRFLESPERMLSALLEG